MTDKQFVSFNSTVYDDIPVSVNAWLLAPEPSLGINEWEVYDLEVEAEDKVLGVIMTQKVYNRLCDEAVEARRNG